MLLGEAKQICEDIAATSLTPRVAKQMHEVALITGAQATTAIEGNTLTFEQVEGIYRGEYQAPPSRAYQEQEVRNGLDALEGIEAQSRRSELEAVSAELICSYNAGVLAAAEHVIRSFMPLTAPAVDAAPKKTSSFTTPG